MNFSYYTVDNLQLAPGRLSTNSWTLEIFDTLPEAIAQYQVLPSSVPKSLGMTDGLHTLELVRCVPLCKYDTEGENILASNYHTSPLWAELSESAAAVEQCMAQLHLRYMLQPYAIVPIPASENLPKHLQNQYLWLNFDRAENSAIRWAYIAGIGWVSLEEWKRRASRHPLVLKYQVDGLTEHGAYLSLEVEPWEYHLLLLHTLERLEQNKHHGGTRS